MWEKSLLSWFLGLYTGWAAPRFNHRHADADLTAMISTSTPPADLDKVSMFASHLAKYKQKARMLVSLPSSALFMSQKALNRQKKTRQIALQSFWSIFNLESSMCCSWSTRFQFYLLIGTLGYLQPFSKPRGAKRSWMSNRTWKNCGIGQIDFTLLPLNRPLIFDAYCEPLAFHTHCNSSWLLFWSRVAWTYATWVPATSRARHQWPSSWQDITVLSATIQSHWVMEMWLKSKLLLAQPRYL